jgi:hypothetical protein
VLKEVGIDTYIGMRKVLFQRPRGKKFQFCDTNVRSQEKQERIDEYVKYEACFFPKTEFALHCGERSNNLHTSKQVVPKECFFECMVDAVL